MKKYAKHLLYLAIISIVGGIILSDFTEPISERFSMRVMTFLKHGTFKPHDLDDENIPRLLYTQLNEKRYYYNPVYIGVYALHYYDTWLENGENDYFLEFYHLFPDDQEPLQSFLNAADWYRANIVIIEQDSIRYGVYKYDFEWPDYGLEKGWVSGMAQGLAVQVLLRAYDVTSDEEYLATAKLAANAFFVEVAKGGVTLKESHEAWWFEEYASKKGNHSFVLNGMCHALIALGELASYDRTYRFPLQKGLKSLVSSLDLYYNGWWSSYDRIGTLAKYKYHRVNINLVRYLYSKYGRRELLVYRTWNSRSPHFFLREFIYQSPNYLDFAILILNVGFIAIVGLVIFAALNMHHKP